MTDCAHIQNRVIEYLMDKQAIPPDILDHIESCENCSVYVHENMRIFEVLDTSKTSAPSPQLIQATLMKIREEDIRSKEKVSWWKIGFASLAVLPVIIGIHLIWVTIISESMEFISPAWAANIKWFILPFFLLGLSLVYGSLPILVGKYFTLQRR